MQQKAGFLELKFLCKLYTNPSLFFLQGKAIEPFFERRKSVSTVFKPPKFLGEGKDTSLFCKSFQSIRGKLKVEKSFWEGIFSVCYFKWIKCFHMHFQVCLCI